jgi:hypothetical protein
MPLVSDPQDQHIEQADVLALPTNLPIKSSGQLPIDSYRESHEHWFVWLVFLLVAVLHTQHHIHNELFDLFWSKIPI